MRRYRETLILVIVMILVGGGIYLMQRGGVIGDEGVVGGGIGVSPLRNCVSELDELAGIMHDYLNGYLSGSDWGTTLPQDLMQEEIERLFHKYQLVVETIIYLYPQGVEIDPLLDQFDQGFDRAMKGIKNNEINFLSQAHKTFHNIDYDVFHHKRTNEVIINN